MTIKEQIKEIVKKYYNPNRCAYETTRIDENKNEHFIDYEIYNLFKDKNTSYKTIDCDNYTSRLFKAIAFIDEKGELDMVSFTEEIRH